MSTLLRTSGRGTAQGLWHRQSVGLCACARLGPLGWDQTTCLPRPSTGWAAQLSLAALCGGVWRLGLSKAEQLFEYQASRRGGAFRAELQPVSAHRAAGAGPRTAASVAACLAETLTTSWQLLGEQPDRPGARAVQAAKLHVWVSCKTGRCHALQVQPAVLQKVVLEEQPPRGESGSMAKGRPKARQSAPSARPPCSWRSLRPTRRQVHAQE